MEYFALEIIKNILELLTVSYFLTDKYINDQKLLNW